MSTLAIVLILLLLLGFFGTGPYWGYSQGWGWGPSGIIGVIALILIILALTGRL